MKKIQIPSKKSGKKNTIATGMGIGICAALLISGAATAGLSSLILNEAIGEGTSYVAVFAIRFIAALIGSLFACKASKENRLPVIGAAALGYFIILIGIGIAMYDGSFRGFGISLISVLLGAVAAYFIQLKANSKPNHRRKYKI